MIIGAGDGRCIPDLLDAAGCKRGDKVLDVACGAGYVAAAAHDRGADATGLDFSTSQVRLAEQTYPKIRFVEGDAEALPFTDSEFAAVLNAFGLPHIPNADKATAEAYRVLKPGGRFAYATWGDPEKCVGFSMVYDAVRAHGSMDVGLPRARTSFVTAIRVMPGNCSAVRGLPTCRSRRSRWSGGRRRPTRLSKGWPEARCARQP